MVIADQIRDRIIDGSYTPGEQINEANVAAELGISRGPVREALQRLNQEGLLISYRNRGVFVVELSVDDVAEIYEARAAIEVGAAWTLVHGEI
ncbi:MAG: GntR family transcriptional regulator, partial [Ilumatobacteraceae bacterium]